MKKIFFSKTLKRQVGTENHVSLTQRIFQSVQVDSSVQGDVENSLSLWEIPVRTAERSEACETVCVGEAVSWVARMCRVRVSSSPISTHPNLPSLGKGLYIPSTFGRGWHKVPGEGFKFINQHPSLPSLIREGASYPLYLWERGAAHIATLPTKAKSAFTLAEVLITLGVIGVVAAMTIPNLMQKNFERRTITQLKATQSILSQALRAVQYEEDSPEVWGITGLNEESAILIAEKMKPALKLALDCGTVDEEAKCAPNEVYKYLNGDANSNISTHSVVYKVLLANGSAVYWAGGNPNTYAIARFYIDTNGKAKPNQWGYDLFQFYLPPNGESLIPAGQPDIATSYLSSCNKNSTGFGCAYYVIHKGNMNYLH